MSRRPRPARCRDDRAVAFGYVGLGAPTPGWLSIFALDAPAP